MHSFYVPIQVLPRPKPFVAGCAIGSFFAFTNEGFGFLLLFQRHMRLLVSLELRGTAVGGRASIVAANERSITSVGVEVL